VAARSAPELLVLHAVRITGMADTARIADRFALPCAVVEELLLDDEACGWVQRIRFVDLRGWSLTPAGRTEGERRLADELDAAGARAVVTGAHREFVALNEAFLQAVTGWQLRHGGRDTPVDPDGRSDERVVRTLGGLHRRLAPIAADLAGALARFDGYDDRLRAALARGEHGQRSYVDGVGIDSCHAVWFELHEDLLATLGLERGSAA
jgi:hypothetical protein